MLNNIMSSVLASEQQKSCFAKSMPRFIILHLGNKVCPHSIYLEAQTTYRSDDHRIEWEEKIKDSQFIQISNDNNIIAAKPPSGSTEIYHCSISLVMYWSRTFSKVATDISQIVM